LDKEVIKYNNLKLKHQTGRLRNHKYKSVGNILHWIYVYGNYDLSNKVQVSADTVEFSGDILATYIFDDVKQIPIFEFNKNFEYWGKELAEQQNIYLSKGK
jgi:hypothetical protein